MATEGRVTQHVVEVVSQPQAAARVTQAVVELLASALVPARVTQAGLELLSANLAGGGARADPYVWGPL